MTISITVYRSSDWVEVQLKGKTIIENHTVSAIEILQALQDEGIIDRLEVTDLPDEDEND